METLEQTLKESHDWAMDRIHYHCEKSEYEDAYSIRAEFREWMDHNIPEVDVFSLEYIGE
jgi:hypothetical protein